jgi:hypothetical protein
MYIYYPHLRKDRLKMIQKIFEVNGYTTTLKDITNKYSTKKSQYGFICKYRNNPTMLKGT